MVEVEEIEKRRGRRATVGEKEAGMRDIPGLGIGIIKRLADDLRQMGGRVEPLWRRRDSHPGPSSHFVRFIDPLVGVPAQVQSLIMDIHINYLAPATTGCETSLLDEASLFA